MLRDESQTKIHKPVSKPADNDILDGRTDRRQLNQTRKRSSLMNVHTLDHISVMTS